MRDILRSAMAALVVIGLAGVSVDAGGVKVKVDFDKTLNFATMRTYAWHPEGAGEVKVLQTTGEDPAALNAKFEPVFREAVDREMARRGFVLDTSGKPDMHIHYYVLIGPSSESQFQGQFLGGVPAWGLPDFAMSTTALKVYEQGTVVLDISTAANRLVVWRAKAEAEIQRRRTFEERKTRIDESVTEMLKKFPPKYNPPKK